MQNYKMVLQYEGTRYNGWQRQGNTDNTLQAIVEKALFDITGEQVEINGSGRTDAGVHAMGQCANFKLQEPVSCEKIKGDLNKSLNKDICVLSVEKADGRFHARLNAKGKTYVYRVAIGEKADVFKRRVMFHYPCTVDVEALKKAAELLTGEHDFKAFCSNHRTKKSTVRTIYSIDISLENQVLEMRFTGNGFLYNMVRILSGTLLDVAVGKIKPEDITTIVGSLDRQKAGPTLPSGGLTLERVYYD